MHDPISRRSLVGAAVTAAAWGISGRSRTAKTAESEPAEKETSEGLIDALAHRSR